MTACLLPHTQRGWTQPQLSSGSQPPTHDTAAASGPAPASSRHCRPQGCLASHIRSSSYNITSHHTTPLYHLTSHHAIISYFILSPVTPFITHNHQPYQSPLTPPRLSTAIRQYSDRTEDFQSLSCLLVPNLTINRDEVPTLTISRDGDDGWPESVTVTSPQKYVSLYQHMTTHNQW